jgi:hypothetical protein
VIDLEKLSMLLDDIADNTITKVHRDGPVVKAASAYLQLLQSVSPDDALAAIEWTNREFRGRTIYEGHPIQTIDTLLQAFAGVQK